MSKGTKFDEGKPRMDLIAPELMIGLGKVLAMGAKKYSARNWEKGFEWGRSIAALKRHLTAFEMGEDIDPESGLPHTYHIACNAMFLLAFFDRKVGIDDRSEFFKDEEDFITRIERESGIPLRITEFPCLDKAIKKCFGEDNG